MLSEAQFRFIWGDLKHILGVKSLEDSSGINILGKTRSCRKWRLYAWLTKTSMSFAIYQRWPWANLWDWNKLRQRLGKVDPSNSHRCTKTTANSSVPMAVDPYQVERDVFLQRIVTCDKTITVTQKINRQIWSGKGKRRLHLKARSRPNLGYQLTRCSWPVSRISEVFYIST